MHSKREKLDKQAFSVLQGDEKFMRKILSRNSSVGRVSQHYRSIGEVPFQWETIPGTPRNNLSRGKTAKEFDVSGEEDINIRPVRPPPVVESSSMPKPQISWKKGKSNLPNSCFWRKNIWKRSKKIQREKKDHVLADGNRLEFDNSESFKFSNSDDADFRPSTSNSSSSSSLSLPDFADDHGAVQSSSNLKGLARKIVNWKF